MTQRGIKTLYRLTETLNDDPKVRRSATAIYDYWNGQTINPSDGLRADLANFFGVKMEQIPQ